MDNRQYHKLLAFFITAILILMTIVGLMIAILNKPKDIQINNYVGKDGQSIKGDPGENGYTPVKGVDYFDGVDSVSTNTVIEKQVFETMKELVFVPVKGDTGEAGEPSPQLIVKVDYDTCQMKTMYEGDDLWKTIAQLPSPCEVSNE